MGLHPGMSSVFVPVLVNRMPWLVSPSKAVAIAGLRARNIVVCAGIMTPLVPATSKISLPWLGKVQDESQTSSMWQILLSVFESCSIIISSSSSSASSLSGDGGSLARPQFPLASAVSRSL